MSRNIANLDPDKVDSLLKSLVDDSVRKVFSHLLTESEKEKQDKISSKIDKQDLRAETEEQQVQDEQEEVEAEETTAQTKTDTSSPKVTAQKLPDSMDAEDVTKMLNIIRAGKSLKDPDVQERFTVWFDLLSPPEKIALKGFLDGIAQIIAGDVEAEEASKPSSKPYNVDMGSEPKTSRRRPDKKTSGDIPKQDTSNDSPIIVGEVSDISEIKKRFIK
tara:strand:- start:41 stop:694 length:654 start_codon:yes stop_codon:yes gene_type:complete